MAGGKIAAPKREKNARAPLVVVVTQPPGVLQQAAVSGTMHAPMADPEHWSAIDSTMDENDVR
jgi:hypothetical protein